MSFSYDDESAAADESASATESASGENSSATETWGRSDPHPADRIIDDVSFAVDGGDTVALVGPTGAGKSTVLKLLLRLYDVDDGEIRIDGQDVRDVSLSSLRRAMGYVGQESYLFYGTVEENITYGTFDASREDRRGRESRGGPRVHPEPTRGLRHDGR